MTAVPERGYPEHLLAREAAPPYAGEGPFALWHFSEDPSLGLFEPRPAAAGSDVISLALPRPHGSVPVRLAGGASQFLLSLPEGVPVRVSAVGGAGDVSLEGQNHVGVAGGSVFTTPDWAAGTGRFDIDATAGASQVTVTARAS
jgi:hypothetical protein